MSEKRGSDIEPSAGAAWANRFLLPHLQEHFSSNRALSCLQIAPDDTTEAEQLRLFGHSCEMLELGPALSIPFPPESFDFIFTGRFPSLAPSHELRQVFAKELHRVLKKKGSLLLVAGNQRCPIDLSRNGSFLHGFRSERCLTLETAENLFLHQVQFSSMRRLRVYGHFGWGSLPPLLRPIGKALDFNWRFLANPARSWLYSSALNPTLILWLNKE